MMLADNGTVLEETHYYPFGLQQKGISYQNTIPGLQNRFRFNGGNELQAGEFSGNAGLELYDAVNRLYDPQLGRFWQIDELAEANWECNPYNFTINNPISFNDPFGLIEGPNHVKTLENVTVIGISGGMWAKTRFLQTLLRNGVDIDRITNNQLRRDMQNVRDIVNFRQRVADQTRKDDEVVVAAVEEIATFFVPMGWITKWKYVRFAVKLFNLKRGKALLKVAEEVIEHGDDAAKGGGNLTMRSDIVIKGAEVANC